MKNEEVPHQTPEKRSPRVDQNPELIEPSDTESEVLSDNEDEPPRRRNKTDKEAVRYLVETEAEPDLPPGNKSNSLHCVNGEENTKLWFDGENMKYWDLCGQMSPAKPAYTAYRVDPETGKLKIDTKLNIRSFIEKMLKAKSSNLEGYEDVLLVRKTYHTSELGNKDFKKRTTIILHAPKSHSSALNKQLIEYSGQQPKRKEHGNSKRRKAPHVKSHPETVREVKESLKRKENKQKILGKLAKMGPRRAVKNYRSLGKLSCALFIA